MARLFTYACLNLCMLILTGCGKQMTITKARLIEDRPVNAISEDYFSDGLSMFRAQNIESAREYFIMAVAADSTHWRAYYYLGLVYRETYNEPAAITSLHNALTYAPAENKERAMIYLALGELWEQQGDYSRAEMSYRTALNLHAGSTRAMAGLSRLEQINR